MSGRNNQKVNFNLRSWNTVVGFRADTDTHSHRMPSLHMHACQAIMRNFIATKRHLWRKNKLPKLCTPVRSKLYARKKSSLTRSLFYGHYHYDNYGYKNFPVYNYTLTGWSKTFKDTTCLAGFVVYCRPCINVHVKGYFYFPQESDTF